MQTLIPMRKILLSAVHHLRKYRTNIIRKKIRPAYAEVQSDPCNFYGPPLAAAYIYFCSPTFHWYKKSVEYYLFVKSNPYCTTIYRYPIFSTRYSLMCKVYTGYCGTSEIEHGLCACTVDNPLAKARGLSLRTGPQTMLCLTCLPRRRLTF